MPHQFNHNLLLLARQYRERSQSAVAKEAGLHQGHYSRIENGLLPDGPSADNVQRIAAVLSFPSDFFYEPDGLVGLPLSVHPMHRKKQSVGERAIRQIHAELNMRLIHLRRLLSAVETKAELPLPWIDVDEGGGPREIAKKIRKGWMLPAGPIENLTAYAERAGILVIWCQFDAPVDGVAMRVNDLPPCVFLNSSCTADRMRFSLAHEIGHLIMHRVPTETIEEEANTFAAELLVPEKELRRSLIGGRLTLERLAQQKAHWHVSMQFLLYQAQETGLYTQFQTQYLWKQLSMRGWRVREPAETDFAHEEPRLFPEIMKLHSQDLGYGLEEFSQFLKFPANDLRRLYGLQASPAQKSTLHVVK